MTLFIGRTYTTPAADLENVIATREHFHITRYISRYLEGGRRKTGCHGEETPE